MRTLLERSVRSSVLKIVASAGAVWLFANGALAGPVKSVEAHASGQIVNHGLCTPTEVCQETHVTGTASVIGRFEGVLSERVNIFNGTYTGTAVFTMPDDSTITTEYGGQVFPADPNGVSSFVESHHVVDGTGKYENASGNLEVTGTADAALRIEIVGVGTLSK